MKLCKIFKQNIYVFDTPLNHSGTQRAPGNSGTWALGHSGTQAIEALESLYLADSIESKTINYPSNPTNHLGIFQMFGKNT